MAQQAAPWRACGVSEAVACELSSRQPRKVDIHSAQAPATGRGPPPAGGPTPPACPHTEAPARPSVSSSLSVCYHVSSHGKVSTILKDVKLYESKFSLSFLGDRKHTGPLLGQRPSGLFHLMKNPESKPRKKKTKKKQIHAPTGKQRSVPGATSGVLPTLLKGRPSGAEGTAPLSW